MMIIVLHPRSDRHRSQKSRQANPCQLNSAKGRRGLSKCGLPRAGGALPTDDYCFAPSLGQAQVPKNAGRRSLANSIVRRAGGALPNAGCQGQAKPCQGRRAGETLPECEGQAKPCLTAAQNCLQQRLLPRSRLLLGPPQSVARRRLDASVLAS